MEGKVPKNIQRLADYINQQENPERFMKALFSFCKPCPNNLADRREKVKIRIR